MLIDIFAWGILAIIVIAILTVFVWDNFIRSTCNHEWEQVHDTKYDNIGIRDRYPIILACTKCGKIKVIR